MEPNLNLYEYVIACLRAKEIPQKQVAAESGVPFSTVCKIAQGAVTEPSVHTIQKLYDYFAARGAEVGSRSKPRPLPESGPGAKSVCQIADPASSNASAAIAVTMPAAANRTATSEECQGVA